jgi:hypothetical protein
MADGESRAAHDERDTNTRPKLFGRSVARVTSSQRPKPHVIVRRARHDADRRILTVLLQLWCCVVRADDAQLEYGGERRRQRRSACTCARRDRRIEGDCALPPPLIDLSCARVRVYMVSCRLPGSSSVSQSPTSEFQCLVDYYCTHQLHHHVQRACDELLARTHDDAATFWHAVALTAEGSATEAIRELDPLQHVPEMALAVNAALINAHRTAKAKGTKTCNTSRAMDINVMKSRGLIRTCDRYVTVWNR